jgi:hypothetical protein
MKSKKIFAGLALAVLLLAIPQALATAQATEYSGTYVTINPGISGGLEFTVTDDKLVGTIEVRGVEYPIDLDLKCQRGDLNWYVGTLTRAGRNYEIRMLCKIIDGNPMITGTFGCPELRFGGFFQVSLVPSQ